MQALTKDFLRVGIRHTGGGYEALSHGHVAAKNQSENVLYRIIHVLDPVARRSVKLTNLLASAWFL